MPRPSVLALAAVLLVGCGSGGLQDEALVGTWTLTGSSAEDFVTVSDTQPITDYGRPPLSGSLAVTGLASATLAHVGAFQRTSAGAAVLLQSVPRGQESETTVSVLLEAAGTGGLFAGNRFLPVVAFEGPAPFALTPGELRVAGVRFADEQGGEAAASGALVFPVRTLTAGQEATAGNAQTREPDADYVVRYAFGGDGQLQVTESLGADARVTPGRWDVLGGDVLRLSVTEGGVRTTFQFTYRVEGGALRLSAFDEGPCPAACQQAVEGAYGLRAGTLTRFRTERAFLFSRSGGASASDGSRAPRLAPAGPRHPLGR